MSGGWLPRAGHAGEQRVSGNQHDGDDRGGGECHSVTTGGADGGRAQRPQHSHDVAEGGVEQPGEGERDFDYDVSSTNHRSPGACRQGRAASISSGENRCTHRYTLELSALGRQAGHVACYPRPRAPTPES